MIMYAIGFLAQCFFSARVLFQWILSERAHKVLSPSIFWILSIAGSYLLCVYGWLREDFAIILGQFISYYVYLWNLKQKDVWAKIPLLFRLILLCTPAIATIGVEMRTEGISEIFFHNTEIPLWMVIFGSIGQLLFTFRFIYQWLYSRKHNESILPRGFWIISLGGSAIIISYGVMRLDPVLMICQSIGCIPYIRNLMIGYREEKTYNAKSE